MNNKEFYIGCRLEFEYINSLGKKVGHSYVSQLVDIIDDHNIIIAAPIYSSRLIEIIPNTTIRCYYTDSVKGLMCFYAVVKEKQAAEGIVTYMASICSGFDSHQRRRHFRIDCVLDAMYRIFTGDETVDSENDGSCECGEDDESWTKTLTRNISASGVCILTKKHILHGQRTGLRLFLKSEDCIELKAISMRSQVSDTVVGGRYETGLQFMEVNRKTEEKLIKFIFEQQRQILKKT